MLSSVDGSIWTETSSRDFYGTSSLIYADGKFVVVGGNYNKGLILTSSDGVTWVSRDSNTNAFLHRLCNGNGLFVTMGWGTVVTSPDGENWTAKDLGTSVPISALTFGNNTFVAVGYTPGPCAIDTCWPPTGPNTILTSSNGIDWTERFSDPSYPLVGVAYGNGIFIAIDINGKVLSSRDGVVWGAEESDINDSIYSVKFMKGNFFAFGNSSMMTSPDGIHWQKRITRTGYDSRILNDAAYDGHTFVVVGYDGTIFQSDPSNEPIGVPALSDIGLGLFSFLAGIASLYVIKKKTYC